MAEVGGPLPALTHVVAIGQGSGEEAALDPVGGVSNLAQADSRASASPRRIRFALAFALLVAASAQAEPPRVYAHRGATQHAPENSLAACAAAFALGASCEVDVRATRDGALVLMHDASVRRTTRGFGRVARLRLSELHALVLDGGSQERVPTLAELLALPRGGHTLLLDLKRADERFHAQLARALVSGGAPPAAIALGVRSEAQARALRASLPGHAQVALIERASEIEAFVAAGAQTIRLEVAWLAQQPALAERVRRAGARLLVLAPGGAASDLRAALAHAPDALLSDDPAAALALARERRP
jgi:glycerophosphoryl diester phosphodiesterase